MFFNEVIKTHQYEINLNKHNRFLKEKALPFDRANSSI